MNSETSQYLKTPLTPEEHPHLGLAWYFAGIDLAPNDGLETGVVAVNRTREIVQMDKVTTDEQVLFFLRSLGPACNVVVGIDAPKSLSIPSKWRQTEIKLYPLRLQRDWDETPIDRFAQRAYRLYHQLKTEGYTAYLTFNHLAKERYDLSIPFRSRSPRGCKAMQANIKQYLRLQNLPKNLSPSSVLDAMVGAYTSWSLYAGTPEETHRYYWDDKHQLMVEPIARVPEVKKPRRRFRRYGRQG